MKMIKVRLVLPATLALFLGACGGGSSNSATTPPPPTNTQPTPLTTVGKITGFGSVYVNGIEFETDSASYEVDDEQLSGDSDVSVGMVVTVKGSVNPDGVSGTADSVSYDDDIEGPVAMLGVDPDDPTNTSRKYFEIFELGVVIVSGTTVFAAEDDPAFGFDTIAEGDNVEVSGVLQGTIRLASYVEKQDALDDDYEVEGTITAVTDPSHFELTLENGGTINVTLAANASFPEGGVMVDQYVEVEGTITSMPDVTPVELEASKVELEDADDFDDSDGEVEKSGPLTAPDPAIPDDPWRIDTTPLMFDDNTEYEPESLANDIADGMTADGLMVEVEGQWVNDVLLVEEIESEEDDLEFRATVAGVTGPDGNPPTDAKNGVVTLSFGGATGTLDVIVDNSTTYMDDDAVIQFNLGTSLPDGTVVEIHAHRDAAGAIVASSLEIDDGSEIEIEGPVGGTYAGDGSDTSITVLGIMFTIDRSMTAMMTSFPDGEPVVGDFVSIEDSAGDGTADVVEIDD